MNIDIDNDDRHAGEEEEEVLDLNEDEGKGYNLKNDEGVTYGTIGVFESIVKNREYDSRDKAAVGIIEISEWIEPSPDHLNFLKNHQKCLQELKKNTKETRKLLRDSKKDYINRIKQAFPTEQHFEEHKLLIICALMYKTNIYSSWCEWIKLKLLSSSRSERRTKRDGFKDKYFNGDEDKLLTFQFTITYHTTTRFKRLKQSLYNVRRPTEEEAKTAATNEANKNRISEEAKLGGEHIKGAEVAVPEKSQMSLEIPPSQPVKSQMSIADFLESEKMNKQQYEDSLEDSLQEGYVYI